MGSGGTVHLYHDRPSLNGGWQVYVPVWAKLWGGCITRLCDDFYVDNFMLYVPALSWPVVGHAVRLVITCIV